MENSDFRNLLPRLPYVRSPPTAVIQTEQDSARPPPTSSDLKRTIGLSI
jgi:hypothetical protein